VSDIRSCGLLWQEPGRGKCHERRCSRTRVRGHENRGPGSFRGTAGAAGSRDPCRCRPGGVHPGIDPVRDRHDAAAELLDGAAGHDGGRGGRAHAHHNPVEPFRRERSGLYRPVVPSRIPRDIPDEEFNEIFAALGSHRDRALVAFYVSTGARASELLSAARGGVDPGRQLITVVRKGTRAVQQLPASADAFVWLRLYQLEMDGVLPRGRGSRCGGRCGGRSGRWPITRCTACSSGRARRRAPARRCIRCGTRRPTGWLRIRPCR